MKKSLIRAGITALVAAIPFMATAQTNPVFQITPNSVRMYEGEARTATLNGGDKYYLGSNSNILTAAAELRDKTVTVHGMIAGLGSVTICSYSDTNPSVSCALLYYEILKKPGVNTIAVGPATIKFGADQVSVGVGESRPITIQGSGATGYYVKDVNGEAIFAQINGDILTLKGVKSGGANVTVCQEGGACGAVYGFVPATDANQLAQNVPKGPAPALSAFYVASNNMGNTFMGKGVILTIKFNTSQEVTYVALKVNSNPVPVTGAGMGPFNATYTMLGGEGPNPVIQMEFASQDGQRGSASFTVSTAQPTSGAQVMLVNPGEINTAALSAAAGNLFTKNIAAGTQGSDVSALQALLKKLGFFSGTVNGVFGPLTQSAVTRYQGSKKITQTGTVGPLTRDALNREK